MTGFKPLGRTKPFKSQTPFPTACTHVQVVPSGMVNPRSASASQSLHEGGLTFESEKNCVILPQAKLISNLFNELIKLYVCENCQSGSAVSSLRYPDPWRTRNFPAVPAEGN